MVENFKLMIEVFKLSIQQQDWNDADELRKQLLLALEDKDAVLDLGISYVKSHLATFEAFHPQVTWLRERIDYIEKRLANREEDLFNEETLEEFFAGYNSPGSNSFLSAVYNLWRASVHRNNDNLFVDLISGSIFNSIDATLIVYWAEKNSIEMDWHQWHPYRSGYSEDPDVLEKEKNSWYQFADLLLEIKNKQR